MKTPRLILMVGIMILVLYLLSLLWFFCLKNYTKKPQEKMTLLQSPSVIPLNIFQTWHTKDLPPYMKKCVQTIKDCNPEFKHFLYDDQECRDFISRNFDVEVLYAYDSLIPGAYKADLWRYCVLYKYGGVYIDIKYQCANGFKLIQLTDQEYYVKDREQNRNGIYNAFMVCKAGEHIMEKCINQVVENVRNRFYGKSALDITGPNMMTSLFTNNELRNLVILYLHNNGKDIVYNGTVILSAYPEYRIEQKKFQKTLHYDDLWKKREVYV
jgi:mannosyltransferase OCH1-like enzyme